MAKKHPEYNFKTVERQDGSLGYYVNGTELQDKTAYERIKQLSDQAADQEMQSVESGFDSAVNKPSELDSMFKKAKGGVIGKKPTASSRGDGCAIKGKTKGRFV